MVERSEAERVRIIVYDGYCHLCSGWARFHHRHLARPPFDLVAMQSQRGRELLAIHGVDPDDPTTFLVLDGGKSLHPVRRRNPSDDCIWRTLATGVAREVGPPPLTRRALQIGREKSLPLVREADELLSAALRSTGTPRVTLHTVLVLGGYGFFGHRICASLAADPSIRLLVGGRHRDRALETVQRLGLGSEQALAIDANHRDFGRLLAESGAEILIHTAGPFQQQDYGVARAAIETGCHYIDLADGRQFVAGIAALDDAARKRDVSVISGASSVPALSSAAVDRYQPRFARLESIEVAISSGARAPGLATVQGIFGYVGRPFHYWSKGGWATAHGWLGLRRHRFPQPLGARLLCRCDIPDLALFPGRYPDVTTVTFEAGFASDPGHLVVWTLAWLVKTRVLPSATPFAAPLNRLSRWIEPFVSDKGGMLVRLKGLGHDGEPLRITWNLIAQNNHGPHIPCGAAVALTRKLCSDGRLPSGAMPCMGVLSVEEYLAALPGLNLQEIVE